MCSRGAVCVKRHMGRLNGLQAYTLLSADVHSQDALLSSTTSNN